MTPEELYAHANEIANAQRRALFLEGMLEADQIVFKHGDSSCTIYNDDELVTKIFAIIRPELEAKEREVEELENAVMWRNEQ